MSFDVPSLLQRMACLVPVALMACATPLHAVEGGSVRFSRRLLLVAPYENATVADLDRDGRLDIVSGAYWFKAPDFAPRAYRPGTSRRST